MNDDIKNSTPQQGDRVVERGHLRAVPPDDPGTPSTMLELAPDSMGGIDAVAMFRVDELSEPAALPGPGADDVRNDAGEPPSASDAEPHTGRHAPDDELDDFELLYADGGTAPAESPKRRLLHRRGRGESRIAEELADAVAATSADVWAAHRDEASSDAQARMFDQSPTPRAAESEGGTQRRRWPPALLAVVTALVICLGVGVALVLAGGGGHREKRQGLKHHASIKDASGTRQTHTLKPHTATTTNDLSRTTKPKHRKHSAKVRDTSVSRSLTTPAAALTTQTPTQTSPPVASDAPQTTSNANTGTTTTKSTTEDSKKTSSATGTTSGGGLPDVQQTDQQP